MGLAGAGLSRCLGSLQSLGADVLSRSQFSVLLLYSSVGVELEHGPDVLERVGPHNSMHDLLDRGPGHLPDGLALQQNGEVSVGHLGLRQVPPCLGGAGLAPGAVQTVELLESRLSPDAEPPHVATGGELQQVQVVHLHHVNSRDVPESLGKTLVLIIKDKRSKLLDTSPIPQLSLASPHTPSGVHLSHIGPGLVLPQEHNGLLGLGEGLDLVSNDKWDLRDALNLVTLGHHRAGTPVAAIAEQMAYLFWAVFTFLCHLLLICNNNSNNSNNSNNPLLLICNNNINNSNNHLLLLLPSPT